MLTLNVIEDHASSNLALHDHNAHVVYFVAGVRPGNWNWLNSH
jgi:hypothetical protein